MATKVSVFGQETEKKKGKPIEFVSYLDSDTEINFKEEDLCKPSQWDNVALITKKHNGVGMDLMLAYDNSMFKNGVLHEAVLYLGHWNDGFVE